MSQIMRLRRIAGSDHEIDDRNNGHRHETAFVKNIRRNGLLHEADLLADSYGGKFNPNAGRELASGMPTGPAPAPITASSPVPQPIQGDVEMTNFSPSLGVDLTKMTRRATGLYVQEIALTAAFSMNVTPASRARAT